MRMYHWVAWHRELAKKIAEGGRDDLVEKIGQVAHKQALDPAKLGRDPLSFFGFLRNSQSKSNEVCKTVQDVFGLPELPDPKFRDIIFPSLKQFAMFPVGNDDLLWRLFEQAAQATKDNPDIKQEDWKVAMDDGVEVGTLTQALFLVNPDCFLPVDSAVDAYFPEGWWKKKEEKIQGDGGYAEYLTTQEEIKKLFPECEPYEIYTFLHWQEDKGVVSKDSNFFQVSTNAINENIDYWDKEVAEGINFKENNWVFVGGAASGISWKKGKSMSLEDIKNAIKEEKPKGTGTPFPLCDDPDRRRNIPPKMGDVVLVRYGLSQGKAIGVVLENDYNKPDGLKAESQIHVLWINKLNSSLDGKTDMAGFNSVKQEKGTYRLFANAEAYKASLELLNQLTGKTTIESGEEVNQDHQQVGENTMKYPRLHPLNTILYGPPGTGKTYDTINYAVAIIEGKFMEVVKEERKGEDKEKGHKRVKERFDEYRGTGQIEMVTFHQNYAYEDFIEGIRPVLEKDGAGDGEVKYELRNGVFREISDQAAKNMEKDEASSATWDLDELLQAFAVSVQDEVQEDETGTREGFELFSEDDKSRATITEVYWDKKGMFESFQLGGSVKKSQKILKNLIERDYKNFYNGKIKSPKDIRPAQPSKSSQHGVALYCYLLFKRMREFHDRWIPEPHSHKEEEGVKNYVLIIDEINRGNIAKIFGELITLIEESRRLGEEEETRVTLPYSGDAEEPFGVPNNLYIIGTMNTADRSIALLDTALRRRFEFKEMMPESAHQEIETDIEGVNLQKLLEKMNERIRVLLDREHQIGHTYFLGLKDMDALKKAFQNKIIPLLQEYFYDNWENIDLVLNQNGFINAKDIDSGLFKKSELIDEQRKIYEILSEDGERWSDPKSYQDIYMKSNDTQK